MSDDALNIRITGDASGAVDAMDQVRDRLREFASDSVREIEKTAAEWLGLHKLIEGTGEAIRHAFDVSDLTQSLGVFTGSAKQAAEAMEFFDKAQQNSRNTAMELASVYRDLLPTAISRGFSKESMLPIVEWLSQLSTISGKTLDEMEHGFQQLVSGRISPGRNPLLSVLGITKKDVDGLGWEQIVTKMEEVAKHFPEFGQSWDSTMKKSKESLLDAFAGGFNEANKSAATGMAGLLETVNSPAIQGSLHDIGKTIAEIGPDIVHSMSAAGGAIKATFGGVELAVGEVASESAEFFEGLSRYAQSALTVTANVFASIASEAEKHPAIATMLGLNPSAVQGLRSISGGLSDQAGLAGDASAFAGRLKDTTADLASSGYDKITAGIDQVTHAFDPFTTGAKQATAATSGLSDELKKILERMGLVTVNTKSAKDALKDAFPSDSDFEQALRTGSWKSVSKSILEPQGTIDQNAANDFAQAVSNGLTKYSDWSLKAGISFADAAALELHDKTVNELTSAFEGLAEGGGKGFMRALQNEFPQLAAAGAKTFAETLFGHRGTDTFNPTTGAFESKDQTYGGLFGKKTAAGANAAIGFASIGMNAYESGLQGDTRAQSALSGGIAGAGLATGVLTAGMGAVLGAAIGYALSQNALNQKRDDYQYAIPTIDANGNVVLERPSGRHAGWDKHSIPNTINDAQAAQMTSQVQDTVDTYRNDYTRLLMSLGVSGSPFSAINGKFQDNPSAHFMEHFQEWMSQTLPRTIAGQFKEELKGGFGNLGLSGSQFDSMWSKYQGLDPAKAASMLTGLADALKSMNDSGKFFGQSAGSRMFDLTGKNNQSFAESLDEGDAKILDFAAHLKDLVGEDQINAAKELGQMETSRADAEKQFLQTVIATIKSAQDAAKALSQSLDVRLIHKADGSADYQGLANYYKSDADSAIAAFTGAKNPQDAQAAWNRFLADLDKVSQAGYGISTQTGDDFTKWAQQQIKNEQPIFDAVVQQMGDDMASRDAAFLAAIQPSIDDFKNSLGGANVVVGDFTGNIEGAGASLARLQKTVDGLNASMSDAGFVQRTIAARQRS